MDKDGKDVTELIIPGEGRYTIDPATGEVTFVPEPSFADSATPVSVKGYDANGTSTTTTYTPNVLPVVPVAKDATSTGKQGEPQSGTPEFDPGVDTASIVKYMLIDKDGNPVEKIEVPDEGIYTIDTKTGVVTFVPEKNFTGTAGGVTVQAENSLGALVTAQYTPTVNPSTPHGENVSSSDYKDKIQIGKPVFTNGDGSELKPGADNPAKFVVDGKTVNETTKPAMNNGERVGSFTVDPETGEITFTPNEGYVGDVDSVMIEVCDMNGTPARATYTVRVLDKKDETVDDKKQESGQNPTNNNHAKEDTTKTDNPEKEIKSSEEGVKNTKEKVKNAEEPVKQVVTERATQRKAAVPEKTATPKTGDSNRMTVYVTSAIASLGAIVALLFKRKKRDEE